MMVRNKTPPPIILVAGKYGCGKTTIAKTIHGELRNFELIAIDLTRKEMGFTHYDSRDTPSVMREMFRRMETRLENGGNVIMERPHQTFLSRRLSYDIILEYRRTAVLLEVVCPEDVAKLRISQRKAHTETHLPGAEDHLDPNDPAIYNRIQGRWEDIASDFNLDSVRSVLSHVVFNTHTQDTQVMQMVKSHRRFIERICGILKPDV